jgi:hypothetical protein
LTGQDLLDQPGRVGWSIEVSATDLDRYVLGSLDLLPSRKKVPQFDVQDLGDPVQLVQGDSLAPRFEVGDGGPLQTDLFGELLLPQLQAHAPLSNPLPE